MSYVASVDLIAVHQDGKQFPVAFRVGAPERISPDEWRCHVTLDGLHSGLGFVHGGDSMQALSLALGLAVNLLRAFVVGGGRLTYFAQESERLDDASWPLESYFGWLGNVAVPPDTR